MEINNKRGRRLRLLAGVFFILFLTATAAFSAGNFREEFTASYKANNFNYIASLVRANSSIMPATVRSIIKEAMSEDIGYGRRMELLDIASAMASMHKHWNFDPELIKEVELVQKAEIKKEEARVAELTKWDEYEKFLGNFVMRGKMKEAEDKGYPPVIYPHWLHRLYYDCKACHQDIFIMKRGENKISHATMKMGFMCGACHNGVAAFSSEDKCERCHSAGMETAEHLKDAAGLDLEKVKSTALRLGALWNSDNLPPGRLALDRFGSIDWLYLKSVGIHNPIKSLKPDASDERRDNTILFEATMAGITPVPFSHKAHSARVKCSSCHNEIFKDELGGQAVTHRAMAEGKFCGYCHGKVAFKQAECKKCHIGSDDKIGAGALKRNK